MLIENSGRRPQAMDVYREDGPHSYETHAWVLYRQPVEGCLQAGL